jgi:AcrR family transcriptional regulator
MGSTARKEREREALRERILDAALEVVTTEGPEALTMRRLADRIEYSATALYAHFEDKDALLVALCRREFQGLAVQMTTFEPSGDPLNDLMLLGHGYCRFAMEHQQAYRLMFLLPGMPSRPEKNLHDEMDAYSLCTSAVSRARLAGVLREDLGDDELVAQTLWSSLHGVLALHIVKDDRGIPWHPIDKRIQVALRMLIDGLRRHQ